MQMTSSLNGEKLVKMSFKDTKSTNKDKKFYFKGKYFDNDIKFWEYVSEWQFTDMDQESFLNEWNMLGKDVFVNCELNNIKFSNGALNNILQECFLHILNKYVYIDP